MSSSRTYSIGISNPTHTLFKYLGLFTVITLLTAASNFALGQVLSNQIKIFSFESEGSTHDGKIFIPESYDNTAKFPAIFLIDFTEQHFKIAKDEFQQVISGVAKIEDLQALVVTLEQHLDDDATPATFEKHATIFRDMAAYVESNYSTKPSKTFIGRGSESGIVMMTMLKQSDTSAVFENFIATDPSGKYSAAIIDLLKQNSFPEKKKKMKLHFSFSSSNDQVKCQEIITYFEAANFPWLHFKSKIYSNNNYENTYKESFAEGLKFVFVKE